MPGKMWKGGFPSDRQFLQEDRMMSSKPCLAVASEPDDGLCPMLGRLGLRGDEKAQSDDFRLAAA